MIFLINEKKFKIKNVKEVGHIINYEITLTFE